MHQYNVGASFERIAIDIAGPFPQGEPVSPDCHGLLYQWPEVYPIPNQEVATVADALVTNFFCLFGVPRELHSDQGGNFESRLM
jgi:hypothetical protein